MKAVMWVVSGLAVAATLAVVLIGWRFEHATQARVDALLQGQPAKPSPHVPGQWVSGDTLRFTDLATLPWPVQRYLRSVLRDDMPVPRSARVTHAGDFLAKPPSGWATFASVEHFGSKPPGFVWDARIDMAPGMPVKVRDAFVDGTGEMRAAIWGVIPVVNVSGTPDIAQGALTRYLAEAPWFPVALLPSRGVRWSALGERSARATLTVGSTTATVDFFFGLDGFVERIYCADRMRDVDGTGVPTPWQGRMRDYGWRGADGMQMRVPAYGEVAWLLPEGEQVYWKGRVTDARYE